MGHTVDNHLAGSRRKVANVSAVDRQQTMDHTLSHNSEQYSTANSYSTIYMKQYGQVEWQQTIDHTLQYNRVHEQYNKVKFSRRR